MEMKTVSSRVIVPPDLARALALGGPSGTDGVSC
jgi:hypothetical protein